LFGLLVVGAAVLAAIGLTIALGLPRGGDRQAGPTGGTPSPSASPAGTGAATLARCTKAWRAVDHVLDAARPAMAQWSTHIDAMNQLVAGTITLAQANEFWAQTRTGAHRRYDEFAARYRSLERSGDADGCPAPGSSPAAPAGLAACEQAAAASAGTLRAARTTLTRWSHHIADMDRLRAGTLDPAMAQQMWLASWRQGEAEVRVYRTRARRSAAMRCPG
jgi:hypothetical protein